MKITARRLRPVVAGVVTVLLASLALVTVGFAGSRDVSTAEFWGTWLLVTVLLLATALALAAVLLSAGTLALRSPRLKKTVRRGIDRLIEYTSRMSGTGLDMGPDAARSASGSMGPAETHVLERVEAAERRILAVAAGSRLAAEDRLTSLESLTKESATESRRAESKQRILTTQQSRDAVRQVEAMLQLMPRVDSSNHRLPFSGGFAMNAESLLWLTDLLLEHQPMRILEVGSGVSSTWMGEFARRYGGSVVSVDHLPEYAEKTRWEVQSRDLQETVDVRLSPLQAVSVRGREFEWYAPGAFEDLRDIDFLVIDGPPRATGEDARYPALPLLVDRLAPGCLVMMDDFNRPDEKRIVEDWLAEFTQFDSLETFNDRIGLLRLRG